MSLEMTPFDRSYTRFYIGVPQ